MSKTTQSKSRPIIFNSEMVNAILEGRKNQTRRVIKKIPSDTSSMRLIGNEWVKVVYLEAHPKPFYLDAIKCPFGKIGDKLWVKEDFAYAKDYKGYLGDAYLDYRATPEYSTGVWKSGYFMKQEQSRITLEITNIRVERLQDISEEDAVAEGCYTNQQYYDQMGAEDVWCCSACNGFGVHAALGQNLGVTEVDCSYCETANLRFKELWVQIKGKDSWDQNPFVFVISFKKEVSNAK